VREKKHLKQYFEQIVAKGGEGVMLNESGSLYSPGRSKNLRKYKPFFDTEVKVIKNLYPNGFQCEQMNGNSVFVSVKLSTLDEQAKKVKEGDYADLSFPNVFTHLPPFVVPLLLALNHLSPWSFFFGSSP